jgi:type VI secretion system protein ImpK
MTSMNSSSVPILPLAFRDTALTVATLGRPASPPSFDGLRQRCRDQVRKLRDEMTTAGFAEDVIQDAIYAQCALLDETVLSHLSGAEREAWEREPLQVAEFGTHQAGEVLIERMQQRLREPQPIPMLLAIFHAVLSLGFRGRFALEGAEAYTAMLRAVSERLGAPDTPSSGVIVRAQAKRCWLAHLSLPLWMLVAVVVAVTTYVLLDRWLDAAVAALAH